MTPNLEDIKRHVAALSDEALLEVNLADFTEAARAIYEEEASQRGLAWPSSGGEEEETAGPVLPPGGKLVSLGKYDSIDEGRFARDLLRNEGIPAWFAGELALRKTDTDPLAGLELLTQADYVEQAELLLSSDVSDEELARQAEAAALQPDAEHQEEEEDEKE